MLLMVASNFMRNGFRCQTQINVQVFFDEIP